MRIVNPLGPLLTLVGIICAIIGIYDLITANQVSCDGQPLSPGDVCSYNGFSYAQILSNQYTLAWQILGFGALCLLIGLVFLWSMFGGRRKR